MGNLKKNIASALGARLKEALASDAKLLKKSVPFLTGAATTMCAIWEERKKKEAEERLYNQDLYRQDDDWRY
ncbi:hypothetical protein VC191_09865 [Citrobacter koseri]|uniref:hypothetical protein n=1 Tax=Citrobacter koseri TaxID=545 RepID=UPI002B3AE7D1|nr:hypothetical protein [Citrobacter koseri]MEB2704099.1 hypothetical protein [Citrobacter koseri]MEB2709024.1 hypothetical protein [Citrobacter koseri]